MAYEKQDWEDALQASKSERSGFDDNTDERKKKKEARMMYIKRSLYKEVKGLLKNKVIKYKDIIRIHGKYGIYVNWALQRACGTPYENVKLLFK